MVKMKLLPFILYLVFSCLLVDIFIIFDIPIFRQILGFLFFAFLPGFLILSILDIESDYLTKTLLCVGISISFLMIFGLFVNNMLLFFGFISPLSTDSLLLAFNLVYIVLLFLVFIFKNEYFSKYISLSLFLEIFKLTIFEKILLVIPFLFPTIGILGVYIMNISGDNSIVLLLFFLISIYVIIICLLNQKISNKVYPLVIYLISISLIILLPLRSNHLIGIDTHLEYYFFKTTLNNFYWKPFANSTLDSTLSISLLPTMFQSFLNIRPEFLFKIFYSFIYSISPLIVYIISKKYLQDIYAFLSSCFFIFQWIFIWTEYNARTSLAVLFFMFFILVLFDDKITSSKKRFLLVLFTISCVISHYTTTYIFFFIILSTYLIIKLLSTKYQLKNSVSLTYVVLFLAFLFLWYSLITEKAFDTGINFIKSIVVNLNNFFVEDARSTPLQSVLGKGIGQKAIPQKIEFILTWLQFSLISIGVGNLLINYKKMSFPWTYPKRPEFMRQRFEVTYSLISILCGCLLIIMIALPFVSIGYGMERLYQLSITVLSVFFSIGAITLSKYIKIKPYILILLVIIPYFLCITGTTYNIFDIHRSIILNSDGEQYDYYYVHDQESACAIWLKEYNEPKIIQADFFGKRILLSQAIYSPHLIADINYNLTSINGPLFLGYYNLKHHTFRTNDENLFNLSDYKPLMSSNLVYNNAGSEVYM